MKKNLNLKKVQTVSATSPTVEVPTNQQKQKVENEYHTTRKWVYGYERKQCERCSNVTVNGLRKFYHRNDKLLCENCLWDNKKNLITLKGITTSQIRKREKLSNFIIWIWEALEFEQLMFLFQF